MSDSLINILLIDTSDSRTTVGYVRSGEVVFDETFEGHIHAEKVDAILDELFKNYTISFSEISCLAVVAGPGSYTGLRIGMSFAKGFASALKIPLIALDSLEALGRSDTDYANKWVLAGMDPGRDEIFYAIIDPKGKLLVPATYCKTDEVLLNMLPKDVHPIITGTGNFKLQRLLGKQDDEPSLGYITLRGMYLSAMRKIKAGEFADLVNLEPLYLKSYYFKVAQN